jgi:hypothetical protein
MYEEALCGCTMGFGVHGLGGVGASHQQSNQLAFPRMVLSYQTASGRHCIPSHLIFGSISD